jgi:pimeloyl-ACP methyl ester carboxylesterase
MGLPATVIFVHGMGEHEKDFSEAAWAFLVEKHESLAQKPLEANRVEFLYNDTFARLRKGPAKALEELEAVIGDSGVLEVVKDLQASQDFIYTHALDVLYWRYDITARLKIIADLSVKLMKHLVDRANTERNLVVVAHSLGTAVMTEVIHNVADQGATAFTRIPAVHMLANVAKVLEHGETPAYDGPRASLCRPDRDIPEDRSAALQHYFNHRNLLDPIPMVDRFRPSWPDSVYHDTPFRAWGDPVQPHDLLAYVKAPDVYLKLLSSISRDGDTYTESVRNQEMREGAERSPADPDRRLLFEGLQDRFSERKNVSSLIKLLRAISGANAW